MQSTTVGGGSGGSSSFGCVVVGVMVMKIFLCVFLYVFRKDNVEEEIPNVKYLSTTISNNYIYIYICVMQFILLIWLLFFVSFTFF